MKSDRPTDRQGTRQHDRKADTKQVRPTDRQGTRHNTTGRQILSRSDQQTDKEQDTTRQEGRY